MSPLKPFLFLVSFSFSQADDPALGKLFKETGTEGALILETLDGETRHVWNEARARKRYTPASTFKIPNTLIALDEGKVANLDEEFPWDGTKHFRPEWNQDQTLRTAFKRSCVWTFQQMARRIERPNYLRHLKTLSYGNQQIGEDLTIFWLDGSLRISAEEQIELMRGLCEETFPYQEESYQQLKEVMVVKKTPAFVQRAKTGWSFRVDEKVRWYVGYLETKDTTWLFAANVEMPEWRANLVEDQIVMGAFKAKRIVEQPEAQ